MGTPDSTMSALQLERMKDDNYLYQSGRDREILKRIMDEVVKPQLASMSGFAPLESLVEPDEHRAGYGMAINLVSPSHRNTKCVRLCKDAISFTHTDTRTSYEIVVFLTRGGVFLTAIRQRLPRYCESSEGTLLPKYVVSNFEAHTSVDEMIDWWESLRKKLDLMWLNNQGNSFTMMVVWALAVHIEEQLQRREQLLQNIRSSLDKFVEIYPVYGSQ